MIPTWSTMTSPILQRLEGALVVSCQAPDESPLRDTDVITRMAQAALLGGAAGIRANGVRDVAAIRATTAAPIIGLEKVPGPDRPVITPSYDAVSALVDAGADIVAIEATATTREVYPALIRRAASLGVLVMADAACADDARRAWELGATFVGTTLSGYTDDSPHQDEPDVEFVATLAGEGIRTVAEGRYSTLEQLGQAFDAGAFAVVVGSAITDPLATTRRMAAFVSRTTR